MKWFNECYGVYLFGIYLLLNVLDWLTGWYKARVKKEASSKAGLNGIIKKVGYWIILLIAFLIPYMFQRLGKDLLDMDLGYLINEIRSILENLIACGYQVPEILKRGLEITEKMLDEKEK